MVVATVKAKVVPGSAEKYIEIGKAYSAAAKAAGAVEHFILPTFEENEFFQYELWESMEALRAFTPTEPAQKFQEDRKPYFLPETKVVRLVETKE